MLGSLISVGDTVKRNEVYVHFPLQADGLIRAGESVADSLSELMNEFGVGRGVVLVDESVQAGPLSSVLESALSDQVTLQVSVSEDSQDADVVSEVRGALATLSGGLVVSVGRARTVSLGKRVAAEATNGEIDQACGDNLLGAPLPHIAVPTSMWPPEDATAILMIRDGLGGARYVHHSHLVPVSVLDSRFLGVGTEEVDARDIADRTLNIAACAATNVGVTIEAQSRALAATHLIGSLRDGRLELRTAVTLAVSSHPTYQVCTRCDGGTVRPELSGHARTPVQACLQAALGNSYESSG